jgi:phosphoribosylaminoimidazole (AIR) synthetase
MVVAVAPEHAEPVMQGLRDAGEHVHRIGRVAPGDGTVRYTGRLL